MIVDDINRLLNDSKAPVDKAWLAATYRRYPYFTLPLLLAVKRSDDEPDRRLAERLAIGSADRRSLALITGKSANLFATFYPPAPEAETPSTDDTIDRFLDSYGSNNPLEIEAINNAIFNPTPDYADILVAQEQQDNPARAVAAQTREDQLINDFIALSQEQERALGGGAAPLHPELDEVEEVAGIRVEQPTQNDDSMLSESLAKLYIAQHKYSKALEIIETINLNFPEKSIYFADQIRYLRKLILLKNEKEQTITT